PHSSDRTSLFYDGVDSDGPRLFPGGMPDTSSYLAPWMQGPSLEDGTRYASTDGWNDAQQADVTRFYNEQGRVGGGYVDPETQYGRFLVKQGWDQLKDYALKALPLTQSMAFKFGGVALGIFESTSTAPESHDRMPGAAQIPGTPEFWELRRLNNAYDAY